MLEGTKELKVLFHSPSYPCSMHKDDLYLNPSVCICQHPGACACPSPCYCPRVCGCPCPSPCTCPLPQYSKTPDQEYHSFRKEKFGILYIDKTGKTFVLEKERDNDYWNYKRPFIAPITVRWDITYKCNLSCPHCYSNAGIEQTIGLPFDKIKNILYLLKDTGVFTIQFLGGEPFIRSDFIDICQEASKLEFLLYINTNGTLLNREKVEKLKRIENLVAIQVGLDGLGDTHNNFRGAKIFDNVVKNISLLVEELGEKIFIGVVHTLRKENVGELESFLQLCQDLNISSVQILTVSPSGRGKDTYENFRLDTEDIKYANEVIKKFENTLQIDPVGLGKSIMDHSIMETERVLPVISLYGCEAGTVSLSLDPVGNMHLCSLLHPSRNIYYNLCNVDTPQELLNIYEHFYLFRETLTKEFCRENCNLYKNKCWGECLVW